ncbi:lysophospholipid acyltransferase family protein [Streptomyces sp. NPDC000994]
MSLWTPSAPCTPRACVETTGSAGSAGAAVPRAVLRLTLLAILVLAGVVLSPLGAQIPAGWVRRWCRAVVRASGVRVRITGTAPPTGGLLLVANHISWLDIPLLAAVRPARMLAKTEIRAWPVAGALAARGGALFIERDRLRALPATVAHIAGELRAGAAVAAFPEGSTWCGRAQGAFHRAVFQAALDAGVPVQPVRIRYLGHAGGAASTAPAFVGDDSLLASLWRVATARGLVAEVDVRPVLPPGTCPDRRTLARAAQQDLPEGCHDGADPHSNATCGHAPAGPASAGHASVGQASVGHASVGEASTGHALAGHALAGHAPAGAAARPPRPHVPAQTRRTVCRYSA